MVIHFEAFGDWLLKKVGEHKAALSIHRYLPFFMEIERQWKTIPDFAALLEHFGTAKLRRVLHPMHWMEEAGLSIPDSAAKANDSDRRRINAILAKVPLVSREKRLLDGYLNRLKEGQKTGATTLRSIRLALSPAAALLTKAGEMERMPPDQGVLDAYLAKTPGQRAAISGFVRYLREVHGVDISLPKPDQGRAKRLRHKKLEAELLALMREAGDSDEFKQRWLSAALAYFHGLPRRAVGLDWKDSLQYSENPEGVIVRWSGREYWLPTMPLRKAIRS